MSRLLLFSAILFSSIGAISAQIQVKPTDDDYRNKCLKSTVLDSLNLSAEGRAAVRALIKAERFETGYVGFAGTPSSYIENFKTILSEPDAAELFEYVFDEATPAGKLYAVSGLYLTDKDAFRGAAEKMKKSGATVQVLNGCLMSDELVAKIVESDAENVAIIEPGKTLKEFWESNAGAHELDIVHGGYPATFKEFADTRTESRR